MGWLDLRDHTGAHDRYRPGLHRLGDLAREVDVQETVLQARAPDLHRVGKLEATLEVPRGDAPVGQPRSLFLRSAVTMQPR